MGRVKWDRRSPRHWGKTSHHKDNDYDSEDITGGRGPNRGASGPPNYVDKGILKPEMENDDDNNNEAPHDPMGRSHWLRGSRVVMDLHYPNAHVTSGSCLLELASLYPNLLSK